MCGICGIFVKDNGSIIPEHIRHLNHMLKHRGPDDEGYLVLNANGSYLLAGKDTPEEVLRSSHSYCPKNFIDSFSESGHLFLGHRRLSILDITANGHQPMCSEREEVWIVFNGEIYNFIELRKELEQYGYSFKTGSDTEVIVNAYLHWGKACVDYLNGMWAFVIYDTKKNILFGSRDRLGVKPLYYFMNKNHFAFASEQKALVKSKLVDTGIHEQAVFDYLVLSHSQTEPEGFFKNIIELRAGHCFELNLKTFNLKEYQYYSPSSIPEYSGVGSMQELSDETGRLIEHAIRIRTRSDVELGACLSGGIDSSYIAIVLNRFFREQRESYKPKVFTAIFPGCKFDEEKWAKKVVDETEFDWLVTKPKANDLLEDLGNMLYAADSPMLSTSTYAQYRVMKLVKANNIKVLLDGQGADELFAGYSQFNHTYFNELASRFKLLTLSKELNSQHAFYKNLKSWLLADLRYWTQGLPSYLSKFFYEQSVFELKYIRSELKNEYRNRFGAVRFPFGTNLNSVLKQYSGGENLQVMLRLGDRMSMNFSVESRTPFADDFHLIKFALSMPSKLKIRNGVNKYILRNAGHGILPEEIRLRRDKVGFQTPEHDWLNELKNEIPDLLENNIDNFIDTGLLKNDLKKLIGSPTSKLDSRLLRFILLSQWRKIYQI